MRPRPFQGRFVIHMMGHSMVNLSTKFEVSTYKGQNKVQKFLWFWEDMGIQAHQQQTIWYSSCDFLFDFSSNYASILYHFRDIVSYLSKAADFQLLHLYLRPQLGGTPFKFRGDIWH